MTEYYDSTDMKLKRRHERVVRTSISMPPLLFDYGQQLARHGGFSTFSGLLQNMLRERAKSEATKPALL